MKYLVLLLFQAFSTNTAEFKLLCPDWDCVQEIVEKAPESRRLIRIRVFEGEPTLLPGSHSVFPPMLDYWRQ